MTAGSPEAVRFTFVSLNTDVDSSDRGKISEFIEFAIPVASTDLFHVQGRATSAINNNVVVSDNLEGTEIKVAGSTGYHSPAHGDLSIVHLTTFHACHHSNRIETHLVLLNYMKK